MSLFLLTYPGVTISTSFVLKLYSKTIGLLYHHFYLNSNTPTLLQLYLTLVNPRRACAARVTVLGSVCLSVCLLSHISPMERLFVLKTLSRTQRATKVKKIYGDFPETTAFKSYTAKHERKSQYANFYDLPAVSFLRLTHSEAPEGTKRLSTTFSLAQNDAY